MEVSLGCGLQSLTIDLLQLIGQALNTFPRELEPHVTFRFTFLATGSDCEWYSRRRVRGKAAWQKWYILKAKDFRGSPENYSR